MSKRLGIMGNAFRSIMGMNAVYGFDIAVEEAFRNILTYSDADEFYCMYEPNQYQEMVIKRKIRATKRKDKEYHMISEYDAMWKKEQIDIDILHSVSMEFLPLYHYRDKCIKGTPPITYTIHGASYPEYITDFYLMQLLAPVKRYDSLICTSTSVKKVVENMHEKISDELREKKHIDVRYNGRLDVVPLGVNLDWFRPMDKIVCRQKLGIPEDSFVILWLGRLSAYDKADLYPLFMVFRRLCSKNPDKKLTLIIAGHDREGTPHIETLKAYAKELMIDSSVIFMQKYDVRNRNEIFSSADVFTSPIDNIQETFGITPIEAMACGIPQIVSDFDGYKDTVQQGITGFKIPSIWSKCDEDISRVGMLPCDPEHRLFLHHFLTAQSIALDLKEYEARFQLLMDQPDLCKKMGEASRKRAEELYDWKHIVHQYDELWEDLSEEYHFEEQEKVHDEMIFLEPSYCRIFSPYVTTTLGDSTIIEMTEEGKKICTNELSYIEHYEYEKSLQETMIASLILHYVNESSNDVTIQSVIHKFHDNNESLVRRGIMKLIKQGFVTYKIVQVKYENKSK